MANDSLSDPARGLNTHLTLSVEKLSNEALKERLFASLSQLEALVQVAVQADLTQHSESIIYHYMTVLHDQLELLRAICEWIVSRAFTPTPDPACTGNSA